MNEILALWDTFGILAKLRKETSLIAKLSNINHHEFGIKKSLSELLLKMGLYQCVRNMKIK